MNDLLRQAMADFQAEYLRIACILNNVAAIVAMAPMPQEPSASEPFVVTERLVEHDEYCDTICVH